MHDEETRHFIRHCSRCTSSRKFYRQWHADGVINRAPMRRTVRFGGDGQARLSDRSPASRGSRFDCRSLWQLLAAQQREGRGGGLHLLRGWGACPPPQLCQLWTSASGQNRRSSRTPLAWGQNSPTEFPLCVLRSLQCTHRPAGCAAQRRGPLPWRCSPGERPCTADSDGLLASAEPPPSACSLPAKTVACRGARQGRERRYTAPLRLRRSPA